MTNRSSDIISPSISAAPRVEPERSARIWRILVGEGLSPVVAEEQALANDTASGWIVHSPIAAHYINTNGSDDQKQRWLPKVMRCW
jgi:hypothetical protein